MLVILVGLEGIFLENFGDGTQKVIDQRFYTIMQSFDVNYWFIFDFVTVYWCFKEFKL